MSVTGKSKTIKSGKMTPVRGGPGHMFGKQHAGPKKPGVSGKISNTSGGKWAKGGGTGYIGNQRGSSKAGSGKVALPGGK